MLTHEDDVRTARVRAASFEGERRPQSYGDTWRAFVLRYGWRAYALPVLTVVTVVALTRMGTSPRSHTAAQSNAARHTASQPAQQPAANPPVGATVPTTTPGVTASSAGALAKQGNAAKQGDAGTLLASDALPAGAKYTTAGLGMFQIVKGTGPVVGSGNVQRYSIDIEDGVTGINTAQYAALVQQVLSDHRSWVGRNGVALQRVDSGRSTSTSRSPRP